MVRHAAEALGGNGRRVPHPATAATATPFGGGELGEELLALRVPSLAPRPACACMPSTAAATWEGGGVCGEGKGACPP